MAGWQGSDRSARLPSNWRDLRKRVLKRDRGVCQIRGPRCIVRAVEVDHVLAGDNHDMTNLRAVCTRCHASKSAQEGAAARKAQGKYNDRRQREQHPGFIQ